MVGVLGDGASVWARWIAALSSYPTYLFLFFLKQQIKTLSVKRLLGGEGAINRSNGPSGLFLGGWGLNKFFFQKMQLVLYHRNSDQSTGWSPIVETV